MNNQFPTAFEMEYRFLLQNLHEDMLKARMPFVDITLCNREVEEYLRNKGYILKELRYDYKKTEKGDEWGFWGRTSGDGHVLLRVMWNDHDQYRNAFGDFRPKD